MALDLTYAGLQLMIAPHEAGARTESRAFLAWYLQHIYRLEPTAAQDAVCDGTDDKGVDGIYVDEDNSRIDIFQSKTVQTERIVGDTQLKEFAGTLAQFASRGSVSELPRTTRTVELAGLLAEEEVGQLIEDGYEVRGVLVTNAPSDPSASAYVRNSSANIVIADRGLITTLFGYQKSVRRGRSPSFSSLWRETEPGS